MSEIIKSKIDAEKFIIKFVNNVFEGEEFVFDDNTLSMINGGRTRLFKENGVYYQYSFGSNWRDQKPTEIGDLDDMVSYCYRHRKDINTAIKLIENFFR
jgi:hypothetical protein